MTCNFPEPSQRVESTGLWITVGGPCDYVDGMPCASWIQDEAIDLGADPAKEFVIGGQVERRLELFMRAVATVAQHPSWGWEQRIPPVVAYDVRLDEHIFIFKIDHNGTTFVVSGAPLIKSQDSR